MIILPNLRKLHVAGFDVANRLESMSETFRLLGRLPSEATHPVLPPGSLLSKRSLLRVGDSHVTDERPVEIVFFKSSRSGRRRVKKASSNGLKIRRNTQKGGGSERGGGCRGPFGDGELAVQLVDDGGHLTLEVRGGRQRGLLARRTHDDNESGAEGYGGGSRNKTPRRLYGIGGSEVNEGV